MNARMTVEAMQERLRTIDEELRALELDRAAKRRGLAALKPHPRQKAGGQASCLSPTCSCGEPMFRHADGSRQCRECDF